MSLAHLFRHVLVRHFVDALWTLGGIGAAADLGLEQFAAAWNEPCPCLARLNTRDVRNDPERDA